MSIRCSVLFAFVVLFFSDRPAAAGTKTWNGSQSMFWNNALNWNEGSIPASGDDLVFPGGGANPTNQNNIAGLTLHSITFSGTGNVVSGTDISLSAGLIELTNFSFFNMAQTNTIQNNIALTANQTFHVESRVFMSGMSQVLIVDTVTASGNISGNFNLVKDGGGTLFLSGTMNSYAGSTTISQGTIRLGNGTAIPSTSPLTLAASASPNQAVLDVNNLNATIYSLSGPAGSFIRLGNGTLQVGDFVYSTFSGVILGTSGTFRISGGGAALTLTGNNTYTGPTLVDARTIVNGSLQSNVTASANLLGTGTVGDVTLNVNAVLSAGIDYGLAGLFHIGALTMNSGTVLIADLNGTTAGTGYDQVVATGTVGLNNLSGSLVVSVGMGFTPPAGTMFKILDKQSAGAINSTFPNLPEGGGLVSGGIEFGITYVGGDGNDVVLTVVNPPSASISAASSTLCAGGSLILTANPASGTGTYTMYQWRRNTVDIGGANNPTYDAGSTGTGSYTVVVTDSAGVMATSGAFVVTDDATAPAVTAPSPATVTQTLCQ